MTVAAPPKIALDTLLPLPVPECDTSRAMLIALRRIAIGGAEDAMAASTLLGQFGLGYRRPLMFLRVLLLELSRVATRSIAIAPSCCRRMTDGEGAILYAIDSAGLFPDAARAGLARTTGSLDVTVALSIAQALGDALADLGRPMTL